MDIPLDHELKFPRLHREDATIVEKDIYGIDSVGVILDADTTLVRESHRCIERAIRTNRSQGILMSCMWEDLSTVASSPSCRACRCRYDHPISDIGIIDCLSSMRDRERDRTRVPCSTHVDLIVGVSLHMGVSYRHLRMEDRILTSIELIRFLREYFSRLEEVASMTKIDPE